MLYLRDQEKIKIKEGENEGKEIKYRNKVRDIEKIGMWDGKKIKIEIKE